MDDEQREHRLLQEQVERARKAQEMAAAARKDNTDEPVGATELKRENPDQPIKLSWKKPQTKGLQGLSSRISKPVRPLAKANPFKTAAAATSKAPGPGVDAEPDPKPALKKAVPKKLSAAEEMMLQDQLRKARQGNDSERRPNASSLERRRSRSPRRH
ncbi:hypothetical protein GGI07_000449 [Coemansia sp. Benny D115]|nr:hypothetical protein GGI07_000449 [Coemansia sp. Benny D115]